MCEQRHDSELELYSSDQLIEELLSRTTFVGLVISSDKEAKGVSAHRNFRLGVSPNLEYGQAVTILDGLLNQMKEALN